MRTKKLNRLNAKVKYEQRNLNRNQIQHIINRRLIDENDYYDKNKILAMKGTEHVDVNSNYLYYCLFKSKRKHDKKKYSELKKQIDKIDNQNKLYVSMSVDEVRKCFDIKKNDFGKYTFKKCIRS